MRLWTVLDALVSRTQVATEQELESGTGSTARTIPPDAFNAAVKGITITDAELTELEELLGIE